MNTWYWGDSSNNFPRRPGKWIEYDLYERKSDKELDTRYIGKLSFCATSETNEEDHIECAKIMNVISSAPKLLNTCKKLKDYISLSHINDKGKILDMLNEVINEAENKKLVISNADDFFGEIKGAIESEILKVAESNKRKKKFHIDKKGYELFFVVEKRTAKTLTVEIEHFIYKVGG